MDKKQQESKSTYGTLTAKYDANGDYAQPGGGEAGSGATTSQSMAEYGTMTAKYDANGDYDKNGGKKGGKNATGQQNDVMTSEYNIGE